jgi:ribosomal protein S28E/S33
MIRIRHPFRVKAIEPRLAFAGKPYARDLGDRVVILEATGRAGSLCIVISKHHVEEFPVGRLMSVEVSGPVIPGDLLHDFEAVPDSQQAPGAGLAPGSPILDREILGPRS